MAIAPCISLSNPKASHSIDETGTHGTPEFLAAIYLDDVTDRFVNWHWHREFEIGFVEEGSILLKCGNRKYSLSSGALRQSLASFLSNISKITDCRTQPIC